MTLTLSLLRGAHVLVLVSLFGTLVSLTMVAPAPARDDAPGRRLIVLARWSAGIALLLGILLITVQAASITGAATVRGTLASVRPVSLHTQFGHLMLSRCLLLLLISGLLGLRHPVIALPLAGAALILQACIGHAGAVGGGIGAWLLVSEGLHLLAAGAWLGGLAPLFIMVNFLPARSAVAACHAFSLVGAIAVAVIAGTALEQTSQWIGGLPGLIGTTYGRLALLKLTLFFVLLGFAAVNRFVLTNGLLNTDAAHARRRLSLSVAIEAVLGALVIIVAAFLASTTPATHEQPDWPFSWRPSLDLLADPEARDLFYSPFALTVGAIVLVVFALFRRRTLPALLTMAAILLAVASARLAPLLTVEAYPTTFVTSPTDFAVGSIALGAKLFSANCANCHGIDGQGDGPAAASLPIRPADLTAPHLVAHTDGELFWFAAHGIVAPTGQPVMPGFSGMISSDGLWAIVDYLRAHHAGMAMQSGGSEDERMPVPQFDALCADGTTVERDDLRGHVLRIVAMPDNAPPPPALPPVEDVDIRTILLTRHPAMRPAVSACATIEAEAWTAFAILLGVTPDELAGMEMLADADLWLRAFWKSPNAGNWNDPSAAVAMLRDIVAHPLLRSATGGHGHRH